MGKTMAVTVQFVERRIQDLLSRMSLDDKIGQMVQLNSNFKDVENYIRMGRVGSLLGFTDRLQRNELQHLVVEKSRLGIPLLMAGDIIHGCRTIFPIPLACSCSWNPALIEDISRIAAKESAVQGLHWILAPVADICRDPRWGRIAEGAGEDPFLSSVMVCAYVRGFQAADLVPGRRMAACVKHFAGYGAVESGKDYNTVELSERTLREIHLPGFKAALDQGAETLMASFNEISGIPSTINPFLLKTILRKEWKSDAVVLSDYAAIKELTDHGCAVDLKEAARLSVLAGIDIDMMSMAYSNHLAELVNEGAVPMKVIDEAVRRVLRLKFSLGLFENPYTEISPKIQVSTTREYRQKALEAATQSMVLLKNENNLLPISPSIRKIAVIGPFAKSRADLLGCWCAEGKKTDVATVLETLRADAPSSVKILHAKGCDADGGNKNGFAEAVKIAKASDAVIMVVGESSNLSGESNCRAHLGLPGHQQALLEKIHSLGKPIVAVLLTGRPLVIPWMAEHIHAILLTWHGGTETSRAVSGILFGKINPCGKLTVSFPRCEGQIPTYYAHKNTGRPSNGPGTVQFFNPLRSGYLDEPNIPLFPFGHGLSYARFAYRNLCVQTPKVKLSGVVKFTVQLSNTGSRAGVEVVQLYVRDLVSSITRPVKELKAFERVSLAAGGTRTIEFNLPVKELGVMGQELKYCVEPGEFQAWIGSDSCQGLTTMFWVETD